MFRPTAATATREAWVQALIRLAHATDGGSGRITRDELKAIAEKAHDSLTAPGETIDPQDRMAVNELNHVFHGYLVDRLLQDLIPHPRSES